MRLEPATLERAGAEDRSAIRRLLSSAELPLAGLDDHLASTIVARADDPDDRIVGCVALELHGKVALLRSLAVEPSRRGSGLGERLTRAALELARRRGVETVCLLTTTAERFFPRFGFRVVERAALPAELEASAELRGACPTSAIAMRLDLGEPDPVERRDGAVPFVPPSPRSASRRTSSP